MTVPKTCGMCGGMKRIPTPSQPEKPEVLNRFTRNARIMHYLNREDLSIDERLKHVRDILENSPHFKCSYCYEIFTKYSVYQSHLNLKHPDRVGNQDMNKDET
jgi:hypothetical protein